MVAPEGLWGPRQEASLQGLETLTDLSHEAGPTASLAEPPRPCRTAVTCIWMDVPMKPSPNSTAEGHLPQICSQETGAAHESCTGVAIGDFG